MSRFAGCRVLNMLNVIRNAATRACMRSIKSTLFILGPGSCEVASRCKYCDVSGRLVLLRLINKKYLLNCCMFVLKQKRHERQQPAPELIDHGDRLATLMIYVRSELSFVSSVVEMGWLPSQKPSRLGQYLKTTRHFILVNTCHTYAP